MTAAKNDIIRKTGLIISLIVLAGSGILFTQIAPGSAGRTAMTLTAITALLSFLSFFLQLKQNRKGPEHHG